MKNKKGISIKLRKISIANLGSVKAGINATDPSYYCTTPKECPTTVDPRTEFNPPTGNAC